MLTPGTRLGPYEIVSSLGAGGMGEVYKGRDTRLDRVVAIKVLPQALASDPAFRERFEREARTVSQLTHPNICPLYDVGEAPDAASFLVMEFLEGETLAARLERGALKLDEALKIANEIVGALDCAHVAGVVHRDLKPANVMLTKTGAKLLDFGLAKKAAAAVTGRGGALIQSATSSALTAEGMIVGTFQYMAPEQLEGTEADARTDIFAFGAILYEMVTGRKAFEGRTPVSLIGAILKDEPPPMTTLVPVTPQSLDRIVRACMSKDPDARFRSAHDLAMQLKWVSESGERRDSSASAVSTAPDGRPATRRRAGWMAAAIVGILALAGGIFLGRSLQDAPLPAEAVQFTITAPENSNLGSGVPTFAVSPDGRQVVFVATTPGSSSISATMLFVRSLGSLAVTPLSGTERGTYPFWSPDSRSVAFFAAGKLKKVQVSDGSLSQLCDAPASRGGTWNQDGVILFAPNVSGALARVSASGGTPVAATSIDPAQGETAHRWPYFLPDGKHFLYQTTSTGRPSEIKVGTLDATDAVAVIASETMAQYASGHLLFWRDGNLMAQPFDAGTRSVGGDAFRVAGPVGQGVGVGNAAFSASPTGVLVHARGNTRPISRLVWIDRAGKQTEESAVAPGEYLNVTLSPDGHRAAVTLLTGTPENRDIWLIDLGRGISSRLTSDPADDRLPHWSPDGSRILFGTIRNGASSLFVKNASGSEPEKLFANLGEVQANPIDWSRDGKYVLYFRQVPKTGFDLMVLPTAEGGKPVPFLETPFNETEGAFSPDSAWIAYTSDESGREEVYVQPFPASGAKYRISVNGGSQPAWQADGRELYFLAPDGTMMAAAVGTPKDLEAPSLQALFPSGIAFTGNRRQYAVTGDGQRFLVNVPQQGSTPTPLTVILNWTALNRK